MTFGSLFTGIGGFDVGFERAGMRCRWQVENDRDCNRVLGRHWPDVERFGDVAKCGAGNLEPVDVICGGFPCQDLSVAGNRAGLAGERSGLWHEFARILGELKPRWCVIENVPGLHTSWSPVEPAPSVVEGSEWEVEESSDFETLLVGLSELGYWYAGCVLDSQYFRVPQRRDRVFVIGCLGAGGAPEILFEPESVRGDSAPGKETGERVAGTLGGSSQSGGFRTTDLDNNGAFVPMVAKPLGAHALSKGRGSDLDNTTYIPLPFDERVITSPGNRSTAKIGAPSPSLNGGGQMTIAIPIQEIGKRQSGTPMNEVGHGKNGDPMYTLQSGAQHGVACFKPNQGATARGISYTPECSITLEAANGGNNKPAIHYGMMVRRLTPRECERLQGFDDDWTRWDAEGQELSDSARYKMCGNAVTATVGEWIGSRLVALKSSGGV